MDIIKLHNYSEITFTDGVANICKPLFAATSICEMQFYRLFADGSRLHLSTIPEWVELFYQERFYEVGNLHKDLNGYQSGAYLWDAWGHDASGYQKCGKIAEDLFGVGHGISIVRRCQDYCDVFDFVGNKHNFSINEFYLSNLDLLNNFIDYFVKRSEPLIKKAMLKRFYIAPANNVQSSSTAQAARIDQSAITITESMRYYNRLTPREKECLLWLFRGKNTPEIAIILNISPRTAEKHIAGIKAKFGCDNQFQLAIKSSVIKERLFFEQILYEVQDTAQEVRSRLYLRGGCVFSSP